MFSVIPIQSRIAIAVVSIYREIPDEVYRNLEGLGGGGDDDKWWEVTYISNWTEVSLWIGKRNEI